MAQLFDEVIAFEPVPEHVECWLANTKIFDNVKINQFALSDKSETVKMKQAKYNSGTSSLEYKSSQLRNSEVIEIEARPLNSFNLPPVDFMKIDVEGHEVAMLKGANEIIAAYLPIIFIEIHDKERKKDINAYDWLTNLGYREVLALPSSNYLFSGR
jgi:FkbM family methyltransferase